MQLLFNLSTFFAEIRSKQALHYVWELEITVSCLFNTFGISSFIKWDLSRIAYKQ